MEGTGLMQHRTMMVGVTLTLLLLAGGCAPGAPESASSGTTASGTAVAPGKKQIVASILSTPAGMHQELTNPQGTSGSVPGLAEMFELTDGDLTYFDETFARHPWLATDVPSLDNGLWEVSPDGTMQTTWKIKP